MALSPEEQAELEELKASTPAVTPKSSGLTQEEKDELASLKASTNPHGPEMYENFLGSESGLAGAASGFLGGAQNKIGGMIQGDLDLAMQAGNKLGLTGPSPTQVNAQLKAQGATGNIGPTSASDLYKQGKEETQSDMDALRAKNPGSFVAGQLAGGLVSPLNKLIPKAGPIKSLQNAPFLARLAGNTAKGTAIGAGAGTVFGALSSNADLTSGSPELMQDIQSGAKFGAKLGGGLNALGTSVSSALNSSNPLLKKLANNRAAATFGVDSETNMAPVYRDEDAAKAGYPQRATPKSVGQTALENDTVTVNPFKSNRDITKNIEGKVNELESQLQNELKKTQEGITPIAKTQQESYADKLRGYINLLTGKQPEINQETIPGKINPSEVESYENFKESDIPQETIPSAKSSENIEASEYIPNGQEVVPETNNQSPILSPEETLYPQEKVLGGAKKNVVVPNEGFDVSQEVIPNEANPNEVSPGINESFTPIGKSDARSSLGNIVEPKNGSEIYPQDTLANDKILPEEVNPSAGEELHPNAEAPEIDKDKLASMESALPVEPLKPRAVLTKEQLSAKINDAIGSQVAHLEDSIPEDVKTKGKILEGMDNVINEILKNANDPIKLNQLKRRYTNIASTIDRDSYKLGEEAKPRADMYKALGGILKNQVENLAEQLQPGLGKKIADMNATMGNLMEAKSSLNDTSSKIKGAGDVVMNPLRNIGNLVTQPANAALAKGANTLSNINPTNVTNKLNQVGAPALKNSIINQNTQKTIYNKDKQKMKQYSDKLSANPSTAHLGTALNDALENNNSMGVTQALFVVQQNPQARKIIDEGDEVS